MTDKNTELQATSSAAAGTDPVATQAGAEDVASKNQKATGSTSRASTSSDTPAAAGKASDSVVGSDMPRSGHASGAKPSEAARTTSAGSGSGSAGGSGGHVGTPPTKPSRRRSIAGPALIVVLLFAIVLAAAWWYQRQEFMRTSTELQSQVRNSADQASQAADQARQALAKTDQQARKIASLEEAVNAARDQSDGLERAFQMLTDSGSELVLLNDIEHLLTIAQQQLLLSGNIANAIISLETAQAQLARANRPGLASLQQTVNGDLDHLRAAQTVDIAMMSTQLDELGQLVSNAPLLMPDDAAPEPLHQASGSATPQAAGNSTESSVDPDAPWWKKGMHVASTWSSEAWSALRQDLGQFIAVRRVDDTTALLMSPEQSARFRENLRMRIMTAQLALMMRQPKIWQTETVALVQAIESRFDQNSPQSRRAVKLARQFSDTSIDVPVPNVDNSLQAVQTLRDQKTKSERLGADTPEADDAGANDANDAPDGSGTPGTSATPADSGTNGTADTPAGNAKAGDQSSTSPSATTSSADEQSLKDKAQPQPDANTSSRGRPSAPGDASSADDASSAGATPAAGAAADTDVSLSASRSPPVRLLAGTTLLTALQG
ncbi:uroporphyrinogen-III C-methyltransferase [Allopusillimonas ginsengisoli]|uniref:uroporphyrinogen-III C-methyltransferase n=1 Tax=Allopusillimonas ginsengisoli TaxID=453575 RepID=UPI0010C20BEC|nr:hypothetical protein D7I39_19740 [Allopusillimonas ginsengisoli]